MSVDQVRHIRDDHDSRGYFTADDHHHFGYAHVERAVGPAGRPSLQDHHRLTLKT